MQNLRLQFGATVRSLRIARDWTQEETAERLGFSVPFYSAIEQGLRSPSFDNLAHMGRVFEVPVWQLFKPVSKTEFRVRVSRATHGKKP